MRNDAPERLREAVVTIAYCACLEPSDVRSIVCQVLLRAADRNNWSNFPNIDVEVRDNLRDCLWFDVYDVVEGIAGYLQQHPRQTSDHKQASAVFDEQLNRFFRREGIGWQLVQGRLEMRGTEAFELAVRQGRDELWAAGKTTAATELHEAIQDMSRRPDPEITGAVQHASLRSNALRVKRPVERKRLEH